MRQPCEVLTYSYYCATSCWYDNTLDTMANREEIKSRPTKSECSSSQEDYQMGWETSRGRINKSTSTKLHSRVIS